MMDSSVLRSALVVVLIVGAFGAAGPTSTSGQFSDGDTQTGVFTAESNGNSPGNFVAYDDKNTNGKQNGNEQTYSVYRINEMRNSNVHFRFVDIGTISNSKIDVEVSTVGREAPIQIDTGPFRLISEGVLDVSGSHVNADSVTLQSGQGNIETSDTTIVGDNSVDIVADNGGQVVAPRLSVDTKGSITISSQSDGINAPNANVISGDHITISASNGDIDLQNATINASRSIRISAINGDINVQGASCNGDSVQITAQNGEVQGECDSDG